MSDQAESERYALAASASHLLHRAEQVASECFAELSRNELTLRQFSVLAAIASDPGLSQIALVRVTGIDRSTLADMMSRMEDRGLVTRAASATDARALSIHLSQNGAAMLRGMDKHARAADAAVLGLLTKPKRRAFLETLIKLAKRADERAEEQERDAKRRAKREARLQARLDGKHKGHRKRV
ncbi:MAG: MarR family transcriptional regulator [Proteobacteria bacterium]|nr:MarR family transcriptional regulator [Pseudomonadota bacterium]